MYGKTRRDRIKNETVREMIQVVPVEEKLRENTLQWFGHIYRSPVDAIIKRVDRIVLGVTLREGEEPIDTRCCIAQRYESIESNRTSNPRQSSMERNGRVADPN